MEWNGMERSNGVFHIDVVWNGQVRTVFISGLPEDVKERELQNLLRWLPGYEASHLNFKAQYPLAFALFSTPHFALSAKHALQVLFILHHAQLINFIIYI